MNLVCERRGEMEHFSQHRQGGHTPRRGRFTGVIVAVSPSSSSRRRSCCCGVSFPAPLFEQLRGERSSKVGIHHRLWLLDRRGSSPERRGCRGRGSGQQKIHVRGGGRSGRQSQGGGGGGVSGS